MLVRIYDCYSVAWLELGRRKLDASVSVKVDWHRSPYVVPNNKFHRNELFDANNFSQEAPVLSRHAVETSCGVVESHVWCRRLGAGRQMLGMSLRFGSLRIADSQEVSPSPGDPLQASLPPTPLEWGLPLFQFWPRCRTPRACGEGESLVYAPSSHSRP